MDNEQFKFGMSLRPVPGYFRSFADYFKRIYVTKIRGFDIDQMCVATLLFEGDDHGLSFSFTHNTFNFSLLIFYVQNYA